MLSTIKRLASDMLGVGENKIRLKPEEIGRAESALTREDVRALIKDKIIYVKTEPGFRRVKKRKRKHAGSRRGSMNARTPEKEKWMMNVRAQRKYLAQLVSAGNLDRKEKRHIYLRVKGGSFKGKKAMLMYLKDNGLYRETGETGGKKATT